MEKNTVSRSYKRTPICKETNSRFGKRNASKAVRRKGSDANGCYYKKIFSGRDYICEYHVHEKSFRQSLEQWREAWEKSGWLKNTFPNWKRAYRAWLTSRKVK
ncbi:MAG: hypothetical protein J6K92_07820 [Oscillospiraceae bacterium]|nr:hypothetical protein [Oscillospiraceae bacterium]